MVAALGTAQLFSREVAAQKSASLLSCPRLRPYAGQYLFCYLHEEKVRLRRLPLLHRHHKPLWYFLMV